MLYRNFSAALSPISNPSFLVLSTQSINGQSRSFDQKW
jgi:hypothetical protein